MSFTLLSLFRAPHRFFALNRDLASKCQSAGARRRMLLMTMSCSIVNVLVQSKSDEAKETFS
jgi:hypothetical protein